MVAVAMLPLLPASFIYVSLGCFALGALLLLIHMERVPSRRRWFGAAVVIAALLLLGASVKATEPDGQCDGNDQYDEEDCYALIYWPDRCQYLEPYSWWWFYFDCANAGGRN